MKKYTRRDQILADIDRAHAKIKKAKEAAQGFLDEEELLTGTGNVVDLRAAREAADREFRKIKYQQDKRLKPLGEKLAEMDTLPLVGTDAICSKCKINKANPEHKCPYKEDVDGDSKSKCDCCDSCTEACADDI